MQVKLRKDEKKLFPDFMRNCLKAAHSHKFTDYYVMLDLKSTKNRLIGSAKPSEGCLILAHTQVEYKEDDNYVFRSWLAWTFLELAPNIYHEELKDIPGELW